MNDKKNITEIEQLKQKLITFAKTNLSNTLIDGFLYCVKYNNKYYVFSDIPSFFTVTPYEEINEKEFQLLQLQSIDRFEKEFLTSMETVQAGRMFKIEFDVR